MRRATLVLPAILIGLTVALPSPAVAQEEPRAPQMEERHAPRVETHTAPAPAPAPAPPVASPAPMPSAPPSEQGPSRWTPRAAALAEDQAVARPRGGSSGGSSAGGSRGGSSRGGSSVSSPPRGDSQGRQRSPSGGSVSSGGSSGGGSSASAGGSRGGGPYSSSGSAERRRYPYPDSDGRYGTGHAVPRGTYPTHPVYPGYGRPGYGYGRYPYYPYYYYPYYGYPYGTWYPWAFGTWGLGFYWDPWYGSTGWYPGTYDYGYSSQSELTGSVRVLVRPKDAQVWVDGYYAGVVDEFDGTFQRLRLEEGPHRIEIRKEGFETMRFDIRVLYDKTINLRGDLVPAAVQQ